MTERASQAISVEIMLDCCPFSFVVSEGRVTRLGRYLAKANPTLAGARLEDAFAAPNGAPSALLSNRRHRIELQLRSGGMVLVGAFLPIGQVGADCLFVGTLSPMQIAKVSDYGLTMSDFGPFDVSADFAMMAQVNEAVLKDTRLLNERLAAAHDEAVRAREKIEAVALVDTLSGLANRAAFQHLLDEPLLDAAPRSLLLLDVDDFKPVNDQYGHAVGDLLIKSIGCCIGEAITANARAFRVGGDEFAVVFRNLAPQEAKQRATGVMRAVQQPHTVQDKRISVSASGGLACRMAALNDLEGLYKAADIALYEAKRSNCSKLQVFSARMGRRELDKKLLERDLIEAVRKGELDVFVQPQYRLDTNELTGGEALARWWNRRLQRYVPPAVFIPIAEAYGLVSQIDLMVFAAVLREQRTMGEAAGSITWCSNLSPVTIAQADLISRVQMLVAEHGPLRAPTEIEITESAILSETAGTRTTLQGICALGISIAIDDFGAGQTSLSHLSRLPVSRMKLDRSLVEKIDRDERAQTIARSIVQLAHELGLSVTAEGIERPSQAERLQRMGPMTAQGFLYSEPVPMVDFVARVYAKECGGARAVSAG